MKEGNNMIYTEHELLSCLESRLNRYEKAIKMKKKEIEWENGFDFPEGNITTWEGAAKELKNTINMITAHKH
jgi:hypothetical protein